MNFRMLIFSGVMTALAGAVLGIVVGHVSPMQSRRPVIFVVGSTLGFLIGTGYEAVQQYKDEEVDE
ncbi:hypothetical protein [Acaryochloris marina]|nr:hypothetical protein [Acaryochloris marina]